MIRLKITDEQIEYATYLVNNCNYGRRGKFDGDKSKQLVGMLAQTVLADYLNNQDLIHQKDLMEVTIT